MATKNDNTGLMSKMAQLIRGQSSSDKSASRHSELGQDSEFNRDALKERIERKRQDDIVRRREFNHLRKLRNTSPLHAGLSAGRPSVFQNSTGYNPEDRALTVKKIDDIEATMSKNWGERKPADAVPSRNSGYAGLAVPTLNTVINANAIPTLTKTVASQAPVSGAKKSQAPSSQFNLPLEQSSEDDFDFTKPRAPAAKPAAAAPVPATASAAPSPARAATPAIAPHVPSPTAVTRVEAAPKSTTVFRSSKRGGLDAGVSVFSSSTFGAIEIEKQQPGSPELQDAAIRFAEHDPDGAQEVLLAALKVVGAEPHLVRGYFSALFDLYRATGQQASFDVVAIDYAQCFGQSAPEWFSLPDLLGRLTAAQEASDQAARPVLSRQIIWECPATLDVLAMKALRASLSLNALPKHLNWGGLKKIEPNAAKELGELFVRWGAQTQQLHFAGAEVLLAVLKSYTPSSDMRVDQMWWQLRLDALRVLRMRDDFESVALDFCVVYELSPPCWTDALCVCVHELIVDGDPTSVLDSIQAESAAIGLDGHDVAVFEFKGEILGDAHATLEALDAHFGEADSVIISCALLARVDFSAAGSLLNWTAARQARGCHVQFRDVPRLVAAFFNVIGIDEHASVVLRTR